MADYIEPFDFKTIFLNYFLGNQSLFAMAFIIITSFACAKFGMSNKIFFPILIIGSILFGVYLGMSIYILVLIIVGYVVFKGIANLVN